MPVFQASLDTSAIASGSAQGVRAVNQLGDSLDAMQARGVRATSAVSSGLATLAKGAVTAFTGIKAFDIGKDAVLAAGKYEMLGVAMYQVGGNAGYSKQQLDAYAASLEQTGIAMTESRELVTRLASAQIDLSKASELARIAQDAAVIGGVNSTEAFERLVHGVTTAQTEVLRTIGITVNFEAAYAKMAATLGKTASSLTENEKIQARVNAVQEQGSRIAGSYEAALGSAYKQMTSIPRYLDNIEVLAGKLGAGLFSDFITGAYDAAKATENWLKSLDQAGELEDYGRSLADGIKTVAGYADDAVAAFVALAAAKKLLATQTGQAAIALASGEAAMAREIMLARDGVKAQLELATARQAEAKAAYNAAFARSAYNTDTTKTMALTRALCAAELELAAATQAAAAAQAKATLSSRALAGARTLTTAATGGVKNLVRMMGGPWVLGLTAAATAIYGIATADNVAEAEAKSYGVTLDSVIERYRDLGKEAESAAEKTRQLTEAERESIAARKEAEQLELDRLQTLIAAQGQEVTRITEGRSGPYRSEVVVQKVKFESEGVAELQMVFEHLRDETNGFQNITDQTISSLVNVRDKLDSISKTQPYSKAASEAQEYIRFLDTHIMRLNQIRGKQKSLGQQNASFFADGVEAALDFAKATDEVGESLRKIDEASNPKSIEDAYKVYNKYIDAGDKAKNTATENAKAQARLTVEYMREKAAAEDLAGTMAALASITLSSAGKGVEASIMHEEAAARYANAARLRKDASALEANIPKIKVGGGGGSGLSENRAVEHAKGAYEKALDAAEQLRLKNIELQASLNGDTLAASVGKVEREYSAQIANIDKDLRDLAAKEAEWRKKGQYTSEVAGFTAQYREQVQAQRDELETLRQTNIELERKNRLTAAMGFDPTAEKGLVEQTQLLNEAYQNGDISLDRYNVRLMQTQQEIARLHQMQGNSTWTEDLNLALGSMVEGYEGIAAGLTETWGGFFTSFSQGFADSIGQAIFMSEDLGASLQNVARGALSSLVSGLIQVGIQALITKAITSAIGQSGSTESAAQASATGGAIAAAYAPAAAMVSLATMGANAAPAMAGMIAMSVLSAGMAMVVGSLIGGHKSGGYTGNVPVDQIASFVHGKEYVINAQTTAQWGVPLLEALFPSGRASDPSAMLGALPGYSAGGYVPPAAASLLGGRAFGNTPARAPLASFGPATASGAGNSPRLVVNFANYGTPKEIGVEHLSEEEVRIIARDEAKNVVASETPILVANQVAHPNSKISKALSNNTKTERRRG